MEKGHQRSSIYNLPRRSSVKDFVKSVVAVRVDMKLRYL